MKLKASDIWDVEIKSKVKLLGNKKKGYFLAVSDNLGFGQNMALTHEELLALKKLLQKVK